MGHGDSGGIELLAQKVKKKKGKEQQKMFFNSSNSLCLSHAFASLWNLFAA